MIVGGGVAGITMALELERSGIDTILLESGGHGPDPATRDLNRGTSTELPYRFADGSRSRFLGGSSNCWGGWCRPFEPMGASSRAHGSPTADGRCPPADMAPYYPRTHEYLDLGPVRLRPRPRASHAVDHRDVVDLPLRRDLVTTSISSFSPPTKLGVKYRDALASSRHVRTFLHAKRHRARDHARGPRRRGRSLPHPVWRDPSRSQDGSWCSPPAASRTPGCSSHRTTCGRPGSATSAISSGASSWTIHGSSRGRCGSTSRGPTTCCSTPSSTTATIR